MPEQKAILRIIKAIASLTRNVYLYRTDFHLSHPPSYHHPSGSVVSIGAFLDSEFSFPVT